MEDDWFLGITRRREYLLRDHWSCGAVWPIWISDDRYSEQIVLGIQEWIEEREGLITYEPWSRSVLVSFAKANDAMLFKLTFGGE
jgi:hypothetical protein